MPRNPKMPTPAAGHEWCSSIGSWTTQESSEQSCMLHWRDINRHNRPAIQPVVLNNRKRKIVTCLHEPLAHTHKHNWGSCPLATKTQGFTTSGQKMSRTKTMSNPKIVSYILFRRVYIVKGTQSLVTLAGSAGQMSKANMYGFPGHCNPKGENKVLTNQLFISTKNEHPTSSGQAF